MSPRIEAPCPRCGVDLEHHAEVEVVGWVTAQRDPEGKVRADLVLHCDACDTDFNAFVALADFQRVPEGT